MLTLEFNQPDNNSSACFQAQICLVQFFSLAETGQSSSLKSCQQSNTYRNGCCCRVRKEIHSMTQSERRRFIETFKKASQRSDFKALIQEHEQWFRTTIHVKAHFLPWHRYYLLEIENILQQIDCRVTLPYWAWCLNAENPWDADLWGSAPHWFGGNGRGSDQCVWNGPFRRGHWTPVGGGCLRRQFSGTLPTCIDINKLLEIDNFDEFELGLRGFHNNFHCNIGGTMCSIQSAEAPEFILNHGFIDKIWNDWQERSLAHRNAYFSTQIGRMPAGGGNPKLYLSAARLPGNVCIEYQEPTSDYALRLRRVLEKTRNAGHPIRVLEYVACPWTALTMNEYSARLFRLSWMERQRVQAVFINRNVCPLRRVPGQQLKESDYSLGFNMTTLES